MHLLAIKQTKDLTARVEFDGGEWPVQFQDPFTPEREEDLRWYFENHLEFPMLDTERASKAAASVEEYGNSLFNQLFSNRELFADVRKTSIRSTPDRDLRLARVSPAALGDVVGSRRA